MNFDDRAVDSETRGPGFESSHRNTYLLFVEKTKIKREREREAENDPLKKSFEMKTKVKKLYFRFFL